MCILANGRKRLISTGTTETAALWQQTGFAVRELSSRESLRVCSGSRTARHALCTALPLWDIGLALPRKIFARMQIDWPALVLQSLYSHVIFLVTVQEQSIRRTVLVLLLLPRQTTNRPEELFWQEKLSLMYFFWCFFFFLRLHGAFLIMYTYFLTGTSMWNNPGNMMSFKAAYNLYIGCI